MINYKKKTKNFKLTLFLFLFSAFFLAFCFIKATMQKT